jgi:hypothetical protein
MKISDVEDIKKIFEQIDIKLNRIIQDLNCTCYEIPCRNTNGEKHIYCPRHGITKYTAKN